MQDGEIVRRVRARYPDAAIAVAGEDCSFELTVVSETFAGMGLLARQRAVLALFAEDIRRGTLHALSVTARTPAEQSDASAAGLTRLTF
ncbi:BolA/IbaG family iron-sulfur metabolism protein [Acidihalobacter prosperus]|uniref:BolA family protein n=1 Tax=Acidihalobacter prosperus TaxID=160660 RepID=A0A1A6C7N2_9GAMM|nr:BolA family protein [Acidihalobacter prosperus]OBS10571.1 BolA family protein [Acidihalobacter prosperus]